MNRNEMPPNHIRRFSDVIESYYLETQEGLFFTVKGLEHPPDRWVAVLRYAPDSTGGERKKGGKSYRRLYHFAEQEQFLRAGYPHYLAYDPLLQTTVQSVPRSLVRRIYDPCLRFKELTQTGPEKGIEYDAAAFTGLLQKEANVPSSSLGITGSLLIGLHSELSDLDIAAFGMQHCRKVHHALRRLLDGGCCDGPRRLDTQGIRELYAQRVPDTHMDFQDFVSLEKQKVNQGCFGKRTYFMRFVKEAHEAGEGYGHQRYAPLGRVAITASIADDQESIFTPCRYEIFSVRKLDGPPLPDLNEIVSFRGRFCEQARAGDSVMARGTLERVQNSRGKTWQRLLLGNCPEDTMVVRR